MSKSICLTITAMIILLNTFLCDPARGDIKKVRVPNTIINELNYLLSFVGTEKQFPHHFSSKRIESVLDFVAAPKESNILYHAGKLNGSPSSYYQFDIRRDLAYVLRLAYNSDIPAVVTFPSTLRMSHWVEIEGQKQKLPKLWELLPRLKSPVILKGVEHIVNSPEKHSGVYYEYDRDRTLILFKHRGRNVFLSLSRQTGISDVGKQGMILGPHENWDYIYSGNSGFSKAGLGWVRSYIYDSYAIAFYYETGIKRRLVRVGMFKWLRAGWNRINFVRQSHIYNGIVRFADAFKEVLESPDLPAASDLALFCRQIKHVSDEQLRAIAKTLLDAIEQRCLKMGLLSKKRAEKLFANQCYLKSLNRKEMESLVILEYVKQQLRKDQNTKLTRLSVSPIKRR
jgi:hypothetical protein